MPRILVVDDSSTIRKVVTSILENNGFDTVEAVDGQDAIEALKKGEAQADLVLVDFVMPRMNGFQFCRALRGDDALCMMPVVLMSAKSDRIREQFVTQTGALDAISKPFDAQALVAVVQNALRRVDAGKASATRLPELEDDEDDRAPPSLDPKEREKKSQDAVAAKIAEIVGATGSWTSTELATKIQGALTVPVMRELYTHISAIFPDDRRKVALSGDLGVIPMGAVLQMLQVERQSGELRCVSELREIIATFRGGLLDMVQSRGAGEEFRLGRYFIEEGVVTQREMETLLGSNDPMSIAPRISRTLEVAEASVPDVNDVQLVDDAEVESLPDMDDSPDTLVGADAPKPHGAEGKEEDKEEDKDDTEPPKDIHEAPTPLASEVALTADGPKSVVQVKSEEGRDVKTDPPPRADAEESPKTTPSGAPRAPMPSDSREKPLVGELLLASGRITETDLRAALVRQTSELVYELLRWEKGTFSFARKGPTALADRAKLGMPLAQVVMEGFRRVDEWRVLETSLGSFESVLVRDPSSLAELDVDNLPKVERTVLDTVDGERTIREIIAATHMSSFEACRIIVQLLEARVVRRKAA